MYETAFFILDVISLVFLLMSFFLFLRMSKEKGFTIFGAALICLFLIVLFNLLSGLNQNLEMLSNIGGYLLTPITGILFIIGITEI